MSRKTDARRESEILSEVITSLSHAVSGTSNSSLSYSISTILKDVTEQMLLASDQRDLRAILERLQQPEIEKAVQSGQVPLDLKRTREMLAEI